MRVRLLLPLATAALLIAPSAASADFPHVVSPGESLYSIAAADGLSVDQLAAANGLSPNSNIASGSTINIPPQGGGGGGGQTGTVGGSSAASAGFPHVVSPGESLYSIAATDGLSVDQLAAANGLSPNSNIASGSTINIPPQGGGGGGGQTGTVGGQPASTTVGDGDGDSDDVGMAAGAAGRTASSQPVGSVAEGDPGAPPYPTPERVSASEVGQIASANGVSPSLAAAIGWQESGFNNDLVSPSDARGVMQILPGTWDWIQRTLTAGVPLAPASAADNVRGGVLLLHSLLNSTGGDPAQAAAGYYQGLPSVQQHGMLRDTQQYVNDVMALRQQFGGG